MSAGESSSDEWARWMHTLSASAPESATEPIGRAVASALADIAASLSGDLGAGSSAAGGATPTTVENEPSGSIDHITLARKPLDGAVAENVLKWGVGGINIDAARIGNDTVGWGGKAAGGQTWTNDNNGLGKNSAPRPVEGRWPANLVLDEDQAAELDKQSGDIPGRVGATDYAHSVGSIGIGAIGSGKKLNHTASKGIADSGGASRFFYVAKPDHKERPKAGGVQHPTVKPLSLMQWLIRLVVPEGGTVLDPFAGSGTTLEAAVRERVQSIGIEREDDYLPLIKQRLERAVAVKDELTGFAAPPPKPKSDDQTALF